MDGEMFSSQAGWCFRVRASNLRCVSLFVLVAFGDSVDPIRRPYVVDGMKSYGQGQPMQAWG